MGFIKTHHLVITILKVLDDVLETPQLGSITSDALSLPERERAKLAHDLVASSDGPTDISIAEAWKTEICDRVNESGKAELLDSDEAIARPRARIRGFTYRI